MFEDLSRKLDGVLRRFRQRGLLTEPMIREGLREVRRALLEADVNFKVTRTFLKRVQEKAMGERVLKSVSPGEQIVKIVHDELALLIGTGDEVALQWSSAPPTVIMLVGLQGSGKTSTAAKLALRLSRQRRSVLLAACDLYRPAAVDQLRVLARRAGVPVHHEADAADPVEVAAGAHRRARREKTAVLIVDTAGRLQIDEPMMEELARLEQVLKPREILLVADAMTGQEAMRIADGFDRVLGLTGFVLAKMDGDARGGAALSIVAVVGVPIVFSGVGERLDDFEAFRPERVVSRMLGMGDILTLVERAEQAVTQERAQEVEQRLLRDQLTLDDLREQLAMVGRMGPLDQLMGFIPGMSALPGGRPEIDPRELSRTAAIIDSMTPEERRRPVLIDGSRRKRIARGSGASVEAVNRLLRQFAQMRKMLKTVRGMAGRKRKSKARRGRPGPGTFGPRRMPG
jgi:signal recognition particle subunit SRP54